MRASPHGQPFNPYPLAQLAACFACGVLAARLGALPLGACVAACAVASAVTLVALARGRGALASASVCAAFLCAGACFEAAARGGVAADRLRRLVEDGTVAAGDAVELEGVLRRAPEVAPDGYYLTLEVGGLRHAGREARASGAVELFAPVRDARALARYEALELRRGARVRVLAELRRADEYRNPGVEPRTEFLERRGLDAAGAIKSPLLVERLGDEAVLLPLHWLDAWRASLHERLTENFSVETAGVLQAAVLGNRHGLSRAAGERFREGGTFHVLVISGLHISFVGGLTLLVARRLTRRRAWQFAASVCLLWAYALAVGAEVSVVRAALMFTLAALAPLFARRGETLNALGGACLALLAWRPGELFDPSFQLTFLSVAGIVALGWPLAESLREIGAWRPTRETPHPPACPRWWRALGEALYWSERESGRDLARQTHSYRLFKTKAAARLERLRAQRLLRYAFVAVLVSLATQVMLLPLQVVYFHRLSPSSLVLNVFTGLLMAACSLGALLVVAVAPLGATFAAPAAWCVERATWLMIHSVDPFSRAGAASLRVPEYEGAAAAVYALYYAPLAFLLVALARWRPLKLTTTSDASAGMDAMRRSRQETDATRGSQRGTGAERESQRAANATREMLKETDAAGESQREAGESSGVRRRSLLRRLFSKQQGFLKWLHFSVRQGFSNWQGFSKWRGFSKWQGVPVGGRRLRRAAWAAFAAAAVVIVAHPLSGPRADGRLRVDFLDVGQGDAALLTLPDGATLLVDAGGRPRFGARGGDDAAAVFERDTRGVGERVVSEFLWRRGLARVDYLVATHAHADHVEGLGDVARNFTVRAALAGRAPSGVAEFDELAAALRRARVPLWLVGRGDTLRFGGVTVDVLWPPRLDAGDAGAQLNTKDVGAPLDTEDARARLIAEGAGPRRVVSERRAGDAEQSSTGNDDSVVLRVRYGERCFLLTGDIERAAEAALVAAGDDLRCDVVKVAHHGSKTSSSRAFVAATRARYAVFPVGLASPYGHPEAGVVARWRAAGAQLLQTGRHGAITFSTDGRDLRVETYVRE